METDALSALVQFGAAGLIGWMWLSERRAAAGRESQLTAAHERILGDKARLDTLVGVLEQNTRIITALELGQRQLVQVLERALGRSSAAGQGPGGGAATAPRE
ncbi:MAG TPA: hypothetical protein VD963_00770 [Phycisphaerales bacterium]|nr:hypothetical protein [Phycisphaerales bacterium]